MNGLFIISGLGILAMLAEILKFRKAVLPLVLVGLAAAFVANLREWSTPVTWFNNMIAFDHIALSFSGVILVTAFFWFILAGDFFRRESVITDHSALILFALVGAVMMTAFKNMNTLFLGIEIMSIPLYVMAASRKEDIRSNEAGFKYLIMGSFASAILLFGIALVYGATATFDLDKIAAVLSSGQELPMFFYAGVIMILSAMCFKVAAAPFHFWAPDVYEGAPTLVTAFMSTVVKTAAFAAILRLFMIVLNDVNGVWHHMLAGVIALSLIIANFTAAVQTSVKRMLAYSSISHAAFMLMVVLANVRSGLSIEAILYYTLAYSAGSIAAFGVLYSVSRHNDHSIDAFNGLAKRNPLMAVCMTIAMLSLAGIPVTAGFFAKYFVFTAVMNSGYKWLLILGAITSAVGAYYYLKVIIAMYFREGDKHVIEESNSSKLVVLIASVATLVIGVVPGIVAEIFEF